LPDDDVAWDEAAGAWRPCPQAELAGLPEQVRAYLAVLNEDALRPPCQQPREIDLAEMQRRSFRRSAIDAEQHRLAI
jgi:hypothetical protein